MATVEIRDHVLWTKHVRDAPDLKRALEALTAESTVKLRIDGEVGLWRKMKANAKTNLQTQGLQPLGSASDRWKELYKLKQETGEVFAPIELIEVTTPERDREDAAPVARWEQASPAEREAAWQAFKALWGAGWRSDGPYGSRDELYDRDEP